MTYFKWTCDFKNSKEKSPLWLTDTLIYKFRKFRFKKQSVAKYTASAVRPLAVKAFSMIYKLNDLGQIIEPLSTAVSSSVGEYSKSIHIMVVNIKWVKKIKWLIWSCVMYVFGKKKKQ